MSRSGTKKPTAEGSVSNQFSERGRGQHTGNLLHYVVVIMC